MMPGGVVRAAFRAMGTRVRCIAPAGYPAFEPVVERVRATFEREELRFSRFRGDSELSRVNAAAGSWTTVSSGFAELTEFALAACERTSGRFDPTLLGAMVAAGYDRDFDEIVAGARAELHPGRPAGGAGGVRLDGRRLLLPAGTALDLGGVAKGWTVDRAALDAVAAGLPWALIDAGGDIRVAGEPPPGGIEIAVEDPEAVETDVGRIVLQDGALATSSVTRRGWGPGLHHLIDPATGAPATGPVLQATVWAPTCADAEISSKDALLGGEPFLNWGPALLVLRDGRILTNIDQGEVAA
jgi:thiamine biosynthesis lipoprotein